MARAIDADEFYKQLEKIRMEYLSEDTLSSDFAAKVFELVMDEYLQNQPTIDPVKQEWVSVNDRLPDVVVTTNSYFETKTVLAWADDRCVFGCFKIYRYDNSFEFYGLDEDETWCNYEVTHWMPLPANPKEGE